MNVEFSAVAADLLSVAVTRSTMLALLTAVPVSLAVLVFFRRRVRRSMT